MYVYVCECFLYVCVTSWFASSNGYTKYTYHTPHKPIQTVSQYSMNAWIEYDRLLNTLAIYLPIFFYRKTITKFKKKNWIILGQLISKKIILQGYYLLRALDGWRANSALYPIDESLLCVAVCVCAVIFVFVNWQKAIEMPTIITISYHVHAHARIPIRWR